MSETNFTAGTWQILESDDPYPCVYIKGFSGVPVLSDKGAKEFFEGSDDPELEQYGDIEIAMLDMTDEPADERAANAYLICAAPDLYDALDLMLQESRRVNWASHFNGDVSILECAELALAKARGES